VPAQEYEFAVGLKEDIMQFLDYFYGTPSVQDSGSIDDIMAKLGVDETDETDDAAQVLTEDDSAIVQLVNKIITDAHKKNVSDIL